MAVEVYSHLSEATDVSFILDESGRDLLLQDLIVRNPGERNESRNAWEWEKSGVYSHGKQDAILATLLEQTPETTPDDIRNAQACYYKDLLKYLDFIPLHHQAIKPIFENLLVVGTSFDWVQSPETVRALVQQFKRIDTKDIRPWIESGRIPKYELWRQQGITTNHFKIGTYLDKEEANMELDRFEAHVHKQSYWVKDASK